MTWRSIGSPARNDWNWQNKATDFEIFRLQWDVSPNITIDNKVYTLYYYNKQNYNSTTAISATSATDKLNSYRKYGNLLPLTQTSRFGQLRMGLWYEYAKTDRYQIPSDPRTWVNAALPNFHESYITTTLQPYAEYQLRVTGRLSVTPGVKYAYYKQAFTQYADNGKTVGNLGGALHALPGRVRAVELGDRGAVRARDRGEPAGHQPVAVGRVVPDRADHENHLRPMRSAHRGGRIRAETPR